MSGPVTEVAVFEITPGEEDAFEAAYRDPRQILTANPECRSARMTRGVESPSRFVLIVEWDSIDARNVGFRETDQFVAWPALMGRTSPRRRTSSTTRTSDRQCPASEVR